MRSEVEVMVVYPITDLRGRAADCLRSWTRELTFARQRYQVVAAVDASDFAAFEKLTCPLHVGEEPAPEGVRGRPGQVDGVHGKSQKQECAGDDARDRQEFCKDAPQGFDDVARHLPHPGRVASMVRPTVAFLHRQPFSRADPRRTENRSGARDPSRDGFAIIGRPGMKRTRLRNASTREGWRRTRLLAKRSANGC